MAECDRKAQLARLTHVELAVIGAASTGRTCIIQRYLRNSFDPSYSPSLEDLAEVDVRIDHGNYLTTTLHFRITDTAGQEDFASMRELSMAQAHMFLVVFSLIDMKTLRYADDLLESLERSRALSPAGPAGSNVAFLLVGSNSDMKAERAVSNTDAQQIASKHKGKYMECSAKTGEGVPEIFHELANMWYQLNPELAHYRHKLRRPGGWQEIERAEEGCCDVA
jgi:small GTP-binding protein